MARTSENWHVLESKNTTLIADVGGRSPSLIYWGERLRHTTPGMIAALAVRQTAKGSASVEVPLTLCPTFGSGFSGAKGIRLHRHGAAWDFDPASADVLEASSQRLSIRSVDPVHWVVLHHTVALDFDSDVLSLETKVTNEGDAPLTLDWCAAATLPIPAHADTLTGFAGRWSGEFQRQTVAQFTGAYVRENTRGRTSHDSFPGLLAHCSHTTEGAGPAFGFHLGWSGNHRVLAEKLWDGRALVQMGELLLPGEIVLEKGASYRSPVLYASFSPDGFSALSRNFHRYVRSHLLSDAARNKPRPVHYNTWEAVYFDHDPGRLKALAEKAARVGAERFVLDDGWFKGRRHDRAGLGDWLPDESIYPDGLTPLIDHVKACGMEFGLWVEPEMVNPDSDLYRAHPDWILSATTTDTVPFRDQLVLDLTRQAVWDHLFACFDTLLTANDIAYLKWDMNRDINQPGSDGRPACHRQVRALYNLLAALRAKHPAVEIESCASGGARTDYGILAHTDRIWASDNNDALDRLEIQRGASFFFPPEVVGGHIGPRLCHVTDRQHSMAFRAAAALFGHMGMEFDLAELTGEEEDVLRAALDLYKQKRALIHGGRLFRLVSKPHALAFGIVSEDRSEGLFTYAQTATRAESVPESFRFEGLDAASRYKMELIWPQSFQTRSPNALEATAETVISGEGLMTAGVQLPLTMPETALVFELTAVD